MTDEDLVDCVRWARPEAVRRLARALGVELPAPPPLVGPRDALRLDGWARRAGRRILAALATRSPPRGGPQGAPARPRRC